MSLDVPTLTDMDSGSVAPSCGDDAGRPLRRGDTLGRYVVLARAGQGAMGIVYAAYDPELDRKVALKVVAGSAQGSRRRLQTRMLSEAQALARLDHPNVVAVHDVGEFEDGLYLAMDFIEGQTLTAWGSDRPWRHKVEALAAAGDGLAAAHHADLVHRDFKPSNLLVDRRGRVRVLDFGLARTTAMPPHGAPPSATRLADGRNPLAASVTSAGGLVGTPAYMAPEQFHGDPPDARADQFSFCVTAWELLHGQRPFAGDTVAAIQAAIEAGDVSTPTRPVPSRRLRAALLRGLQRDPRARHPDMESLVGALRRAAGPTGRSRGIMVLGAAGLTGAVVASWAVTESAPQRRPCTGGGEEIATAWGTAERAAARTGVLGTDASFAEASWERTVSSLDAYARDWVEMHEEACAATTVRGEQSSEVMDLRMQCLRRARLELGAVAGVLARADAAVVSRAGRIVASLPAVAACADVEALRSTHPLPRPEDADAVDDARVALARARVERRAGHPKVALTAVEEAATTLEGVHDRHAWAQLGFERGMVLSALGKWTEAEAVLQEALQGAIRARDTDLMRRVSGKLLLVVGGNLGRADEALLRYRDLAEGLAAETPGKRADMARRIAHVLHKTGALDEAEAEIRRALALVEEADLPPAQRASATDSLAIILEEQGRHEEAERMARLAVQRYREVSGPQHPNVANAHVNLGRVLDSLGRLDEAEIALRTAVGLYERGLGRDHPHADMARNNLGTMHGRRGEYARAEAAFEEVLASRERAFGPDHPLVAGVLSNLGLAVFSQGRHDDAEAHFERALQIRVAAQGEDDVSLAPVHAGLASVASARGDRDAAARHLRRKLAVEEGTLGRDHPSVGATLCELADIERVRGNFDEARAFAERAIAVFEPVPDHPMAPVPLVARGRVRWAQGEREPGAADVRRGVDGLVALGGQEVPVRAAAQVALSGMLVELGQAAQALPPIEEAWTHFGREDVAAAGRAEAGLTRAQVHWALAEDRAARTQARAMAETAAADYARAGDGFARDAAAARAWLDDHPTR